MKKRDRWYRAVNRLLLDPWFVLSMVAVFYLSGLLLRDLFDPGISLDLRPPEA